MVGALAAGSVRRLGPLALPFSIYVAAFLAGNLMTTAQELRASSHAEEDYLAIAQFSPQGANFVRIKYPTPRVSARYGFQETPWDPLIHPDAYIAAQCRCVDLSDYEVATGTFPVIFKRVSVHDQTALWDLEGRSYAASETLLPLEKTLPVAIDYVILLADESSPQGSDLSRLRAELDSDMRLVAVSPPANPFVRLYARQP
jgi:hypothetical protein